MKIKTVFIVVVAVVCGIAIGALATQQIQKQQRGSSAEKTSRCIAAEKNVMLLVKLAHVGRYKDSAIDDAVKSWAESKYEPTVMTPFEINVARAVVARHDVWKDFVLSKKVVRGYGETDDYDSLIPVVKPIYTEVCMGM